MSDLKKRKEATAEARQRLNILIKKIEEGDFDAKIYKRYDRDVEEDEEYPDDSDALDDIIEWFDVNIRPLVVASNFDPKKDVSRNKLSTDLNIQQYIRKIEKALNSREEDVYEEISKLRKAEYEAKQEVEKIVEKTLKLINSRPNIKLDERSTKKLFEIKLLPLFKIISRGDPEVVDKMMAEKLEEIQNAIRKRQLKEKKLKQEEDYEVKREADAYRRANIYDIQQKTAKYKVK